ncbi:MAG: hypothetical protein GX573_13515 [Chloroflexi bacterium]|nr:hypothetical protein [Chloroflexota bacterium]
MPSEPLVASGQPFVSNNGHSPAPDESETSLVQHAGHRASSTLDDGRKLVLTVELATALSRVKHSDGRVIKNAVNLALFIQQTHYWTCKAQQNRDQGNNGMQGQLDDEGKLWIYNSIASWEKNFPFWASTTIRSLRNDLVKLGLLRVQQRGKDWSENPGPGRAVTWYCLDYAAIDALEIQAEAASQFGGVIPCNHRRGDPSKHWRATKSTSREYPTNNKEHTHRWRGDGGWRGFEKRRAG